METSNLAAALALAERGYPVFPIHTVRDGRCSCGNDHAATPRDIGKHPVAYYAPHGVKDATLDFDTISAIWTQMPDANIGVATGSRSQLWVLDVDLDHDGPDSLHELEARYGELPTTAFVQTGGGGQHIWFQLPPGVVVRNSTSQLGPGLDVRGEGGYVIAPPSMHASGREYVWDLLGNIEDVPLAYAPAWLMGLLEQGATQSSIRSDVDTTESLVGSGGRNEFLARELGHQRKTGAGYAQLLEIGLAVNETRCNPPLPKEEVAKIAASVARYPAGLPLPVSVGEVLAQTVTPPSFEESGFTVTDLYDMVREPIQPTAWVLDRTLALGGISIFAAKPKSGKSTALRSWLMAMARGDEAFLGRKIRQGAALYLPLEERPGLVANHFLDMNAFRDGMRGTVLIGRGLPPGGGATAIAEAIARARALTEREIVLVIIDNLYDAVTISNLDNYAVVQTEFKRPMIALAQAENVHLLFVVHTRKGQAGGGGGDQFDSMIGSTAFRGATDANLLLKVERGKRRVLTVEVREGEPIDDMVLEFDPVTRQVSEGGNLADAIAHDLENEVIQAILELGGQPGGREVWQRDVVGRIHRRPGDVSSTINLLASQGRASTTRGYPGHTATVILLPGYGSQTFVKPPPPADLSNFPAHQLSGISLDPGLRAEQLDWIDGDEPL